MTLLTDSSPLGKQNFLACYQKVRKEALSANNIKNWRKATDLWPKSIAKPLVSPLLLENSNTAEETPKQASKTLIKGSEVDSSNTVIWSKPEKLTELKPKQLSSKSSKTMTIDIKALISKDYKGF